jgi:hypothetical protein
MMLCRTQPNKCTQSAACNQERPKNSNRHTLCDCCLVVFILLFKVSCILFINTLSYTSGGYASGLPLALISWNAMLSGHGNRK